MACPSKTTYGKSAPEMTAVGLYSMRTNTSSTGNIFGLSENSGVGIL